jgi:hypothetical protein
MLVLSRIPSADLKFRSDEVAWFYALFCLLKCFALHEFDFTLNLEMTLPLRLAILSGLSA